jgi:hypothetical protein
MELLPNLYLTANPWHCDNPLPVSWRQPSHESGDIIFECLADRVALVIVSRSREGKQFSFEICQPWRTLGQ